MVFPIALAAVVAVVGASLIAAAAVLAYRLHPSNTKVPAPRDLEHTAPLRKVRVRQGRVTSTVSTVRPTNSVYSKVECRTTLDLDEETEAHRQDFPPLPTDREGKLIGIDSPGALSPKPPEPAYSPGKRALLDELSFHQPAMPSIVESAQTLSPRRSSIKPLPSHTDEKPSRMDIALDLANDHKRTLPTKSASFDHTRKMSLASESDSHSRRPSRARGISDAAASSSSTSARTRDVKALASQLATPPMSGSRQWHNSQTSYGSASSGQQKVAHVDLQASTPFRNDYGFPSPPPSATFEMALFPPVAPCTQTPLAESGSGRQRKDSMPVSPNTATFQVSNIESPSSRLSHHHRSPPASQNSSSSASRPSSSKPTSARKRPPPITLATSSDGPTSARSRGSMLGLGLDPESFILSPSGSDSSSAPAESIPSRNNDMSARYSVQTFRSSDLSPTFSVAPVSRVLLYRGKILESPSVKVVGEHKAASPQLASVLRSQTLPELSTSHVSTMSMQAHDEPQSLDQMTLSSKVASPVMARAAQLPRHGPASELVSSDANSLRLLPKRGRSVSADVTFQHLTGPVAKPTPGPSQVPMITRPAIAKTRSLSGNVRFSNSQSQANSNPNRSSPSAKLAGLSDPRPSRNSRYSHLTSPVDKKALPTLPAPEIRPTVGARQSHYQAHSRKGSLPTHQPGFHAPPNPEVLSKILGLSPSSTTRSPGVPRTVVQSLPVASGSDNPASGPRSILEVHALQNPSTKGHLRSLSGMRVPPAPTGAKNGKGVGLETAPGSRMSETIKV